MTRLLQDFAAGTLSAGAITATQTIISSPQFAPLPVVGSPDSITLILDPYAIYGAPEHVTITTHTSAATSVTVLRGQDGLTGAPGTVTGLPARTHNNSGAQEQWVLSYTAADFGAVNAQLATLTGNVSTNTSSISTLTSELAGLTWEGEKTWAVTGTFDVTSGSDDYLPPAYAAVPSGQTVSIIGMVCSVRSGSAQVSVLVNGSAVPGLTGVSVTTTPTYTAASSPAALSNLEPYQPTVTSVTNTPDGLSVTVFRRITI